MIILAIETSCDETAVSLIKTTGKDNIKYNILSEKISSQIKIHQPFGGVVPSLARRAHQENLPLILDQALIEANLENSPKPTNIDINELDSLLKKEEDLLKIFKEKIVHQLIPNIDLIAVTYGPGLEPALWVGINFARALSLIWQKPLIGVNHLEGHIVSPLVNQENKIKFPCLALIISGGHTELVLVKENFRYQKIGGTRDDAVGEAFDKVARLLNLEYPGGPQITKLAKEAENIDTSDWKMPRPMINSNDFDFSFSGLKTAVLYSINKKGELSSDDKKKIAKEFQEAVIDVLIHKTSKAVKEYNIKTIIIGGGVIANTTLRDKFNFHFKDLNILIPSIDHSTDNATMIGVAAYIKQLVNKPEINPEIIADGNLDLS